MSRVEGSVTTHFHYDQDGRLLAESDGTGVLIREYLWLGDKPLGLVVGPAGSPALYFVHADHLERVQKITDASQAIVWDGQFTPYGRTHAIAGTVQNPLRFPGQWADPAANYFYNYMRDYDSTLARYLSVDPTGTEGGRNRFTYASANPQNVVDPKGEIVWIFVAIGVGLLLEAGADYVERKYCGCESGSSPLQYPIAAAAGAAIGDALSPVPYPRRGLGGPQASGRTSRLSRALSARSIRGPRLPAPTLRNPGASTRNVGRAFGRAAPIVGAAYGLYDVYRIARCVGQ